MTQAHQARLAYLDPQALQAHQAPLEEDLKALGNQTCSTASAQVTSPAPGNLSPPLVSQLLGFIRVLQLDFFKQREILPKARIPSCDMSVAALRGLTRE